MKGRGFYWLAVAGGAAALFLGGVRAAYSYTYCADPEPLNCYTLDETVQDTCCADVYGSGITYLATCTRDRLECVDDNFQTYTDLGPGYNCTNVGQQCP